MKTPTCFQCNGLLVPWRRAKNVYLCPCCGMARQFPMPHKDRLKSLYSRSYYDSWGEPQVYWDLKKALYKGLLSQAKGSRSTGNILDVGCATGACLAVIEQMGKTAFGIDVNPEAIRLARKNVPGATILEASLENAPFEKGMFEAVVLSDVLEHLSDPRAALKRVRALLAPGGAAVILTPHMGSLSSKIMGRTWIHVKEEHLFYFSRDALGQMLVEAGFHDACFIASKKPVSIQYAMTQFETYPLPVATPFLRFLGVILPKTLKNRVFALPMGEMCVAALK